MSERSIRPCIQDDSQGGWEEATQASTVVRRGDDDEGSKYSERLNAIHTGFRDPDLDLRLGNPLSLRPIFEARPAAPVVLLHAGYPFVRETGSRRSTLKSMPISALRYPS